MSESFPYSRATLNPGQYPSPEPSPEPSPNACEGVGAHGKKSYQVQWSTKVEGLKANEEDREEDSWHSADDDYSGPALSTPSPQLRASEKDFVNGDANLRDHGPVNTSKMARAEMRETVLKLSPAMIHELTSSPESLPLHVHSTNKSSTQTSWQRSNTRPDFLGSQHPYQELQNDVVDMAQNNNRSRSANAFPLTDRGPPQSDRLSYSTRGRNGISRSHRLLRASSTSPSRRKKSSTKFVSTRIPLTASSKHSHATPMPLQLRDSMVENKASALDGSIASPMPQSIPLPPLSLPTYLQLELSSHRPSPLYIHRSACSDFPYESSRVKVERLQNFLLLPPQLEQVLWFGALACLDSWLFSFTILPLRFLKALSILAQSWGRNLAAEVRSVGSFIYAGTGRMWRRQRGRDSATASSIQSSSKRTMKRPATGSSPQMTQFPFPEDNDNENSSAIHSHPEPNPKCNTFQRHRRSKSVPSALLPDHKADILKGLLIIISCTILMHFDASRMYHGIRGQAAIKLYVIYNVLEVST